MNSFKIDEGLKGLRIDQAISKKLNISRSLSKSMIDENLVKVNGSFVKSSYKALLNDQVEYELKEKETLDIKPENLNIEIVYEDEDVAVVNKPSGMVVHPACGNYEHTLVNGLMYQMDIEDSINNVMRPGIVHRIDKDTSGLLMIAKNDLAMASLQAQLKDHSSKRIYIALVYGIIGEEKGRIELPIGRDKIDRKKMAVREDGKRAVTNFTVLERFKDMTLLSLRLETGRTHQIRVHMKYIGHPVVGDKVYGPRKVIGDNGQFLHAKVIGFVHPRTKEYLEFDSELPEYFKNYLDELRQNK